MSEAILIVGGEGFVGSHITRTLLAAGCAVTTFGPPMAADLLAGLAHPGLRRLRGSAQDPDEVQAALRTSAAGALVWSAGFNTEASGLMASGELDIAAAVAVNVGAWASVLRVAARAGLRRVVACGSTVVYGAASDYAGAVGEDAAHLPRSIYGLTKSLAESTACHFARNEGLDVVTLRLPLVFGPGRWYGGAASGLVRMIEAAARGTGLSLTLPAEPFDLMYVKDAARAVAAALAAPQRVPAYNVNGFTTRHGEIADTLRALCPGFAPHLTLQPSAWAYPLMDASRFGRDTGFRAAFTLDSALRDYLGELAP